jgi:ferredoxin
VKELAQELSSERVVDYDLSLITHDFSLFLNDGLLVIATPVYAGRIPQIFLDHIEKLQGNGFHVLAAGAFIGEHSFSTQAFPIAANRPDTQDLQSVKDFGAAILKKLSTIKNASLLNIPGNIPYKERGPLGGICPETNQDLCTLCKTCADICPAFVITVDQAVSTAAQNCIMCCACVKSCPESARTMVHPMV